MYNRWGVPYFKKALFGGVTILRTLVFGGLRWSPALHENYHVHIPDNLMDALQQQP